MGDNNLVLFVMKDNLEVLDYHENVVSEYEVPLISGAARFGQGMVPQFFLTDNMGDDEISMKYPRFGHFTSVYWAWKNADASFVGLVSDRAHFAISDEEIAELFSMGADAILPMQSECKKSIREIYSSQYYGYDLEMLEELIRIETPEYYETAKLLLDNNTIFEKCCGIYRMECFEEFCAFAFPLLEKMDEMCPQRVDQMQNRMIEHLGELLHYIYFMQNYAKYDLKQAPLYQTNIQQERLQRILSEYDIIQYSKFLFAEGRMEEAGDFLLSLEKKHLVYADVRRIRNMLQIHRIERYREALTVLDRKPDVDALIKHHENLENYIVNYINGIGRNKDFIRYIDTNGVVPDELLFILDYFEANSAEVYLMFLTLFEEANKMEFVLPFMEMAVQKRNCVAMVEAKMREVVAKFG